MGILVMACYRPGEGRETALLDFVRQHHDVLRRQDLVSERLPMLMRAGDGTIIETFEWSSREAIERAHRDPVVEAMWARFGECCEYVPIGSLEEAGRPFSEFEPIAP